MLVLVLGAAGMLGRDVVSALSQKGIPHLSFDRKQMDISNELGLRRLMKYHNITHAINCAAYTDVPKAEKEAKKATQINCDYVKNLSVACRKDNVALIHFSTDYVFDGCKIQKYQEDDNTFPLNIYGKSKLAGEKVVQENCDNYKIFRLQWLYGKNGNNFVHKILKAHDENGYIKIVADQMGSPCSTLFVSNILMNVLDRWDDAESGIYHLVHDDSCSWFDFAKYVMGCFNRKSFVKPISHKKFNGGVVRPNNAVLDNFKTISSFRFDSLGSWKHDFDNYLSTNPYLWDYIKK